MVVHGTAVHQMTVQFKLLQFQLRPSIVNQDPNVKDPEIQNVKLFRKNDNRPIL